MSKKKIYKCACSCGCRRKPGSRRVECSNCGHHVCPGYCLALDEIDVNTDGVYYKYSLCRQCLKRDTRLCDDGVDRIMCDGEPWHPQRSLQEIIIAYISYTLIQASLLQYEDTSDEWHILWSKLRWVLAHSADALLLYTANTTKSHHHGKNGSLARHSRP